MPIKISRDIMTRNAIYGVVVSWMNLSYLSCSDIMITRDRAYIFFYKYNKIFSL